MIEREPLLGGFGGHSLRHILAKKLTETTLLVHVLSGVLRSLKVQGCADVDLVHGLDKI